MDGGGSLCYGGNHLEHINVSNQHVVHFKLT